LHGLLFGPEDGNSTLLQNLSRIPENVCGITHQKLILFKGIVSPK
jgi:hypothetical protein